MNRKVLYGILGVAVLGVGGWFTFQALSSSLVYFLLPHEYASSAADYDGRRLRLGGIVEHGSLNFNDDTVRLDFQISDSQLSYPVSHRGSPPALFTEGVGVVVEGSFVEGVFHSDNLLVRHSEVYEVGDDGIDDAELREFLK